MHLPATLRQRSRAILGAVVTRPLLRLAILTPLTAVMLRMVGGTLYASLSFVPNWPLLLGYGLFFAVGWLLYLQREHFLKFERFAWTQTLAGLVILLFFLPAVRELAGPLPRPTLLFLSTLVNGTVVWLLFFGLTGLFLRHLNRPSPIARYVADASFWIYMIHLPIVIWVAGILSVVAWTPWLKIGVILVVTYLAGFLSYDLFVRSTIIGAVLSGRRYERRFFEVKAPIAT
jgi:peptidoglycan/LPS O-acetylase OafA/YrhL